MTFIEKDTYFEKLEQRAKTAFSESELQATQAILKVIKGDYQQRELYFYNLKKQIIARHDWTDADFFEPFLDIVQALLGEIHFEFFQYIINHKYEYPYSTGYDRRPFRTTKITSHMKGIFNSFIDLFDWDRSDCSVIDYLKKADHTWDYNPIISDYIAFEIDRQNEEVIQFLKEVIYGDNNTALLTSFIIKGILKSHSQSGYQMIGELLLAARLQEGLRQSIVETMDEGTIEATLYLLKLIIDHDLIRFSSVLRALAVWTGLNLEGTSKKVVKQLIEQVLQTLTHQSLREQGLTSKDTNSLYISLWATAFYEEEAIRAPITDLMDSGGFHQKVAAQFFLSQSQNSLLKFELSSPYLQEEGFELQSYLVANYSFDYHTLWSYNGKEELRLVIDRVPLLEDKTKRFHHFSLFKKIVMNLPKKELSVQSNAIPGITTSLSADDVARKMLYLILYDMDQAWLAQLLEWKDRLSSDIKGTLLAYFIRDFNDQTQRNFLFECLSDRSLSIRETALAKMETVELSDSEMEKVEAILKLKTGTLRQAAIQLISKLPVEQLKIAIGRLLGSRQELQRMGALDLLSEIKNQPKKSIVFEEYKVLLNHKKREQITAKEQVLIDKLFEAEGYSRENGFGLYDPNRLVRFEIDTPKIKVKDFFTLTVKRVKDFLEGLSKLVHEHRFVEYEVEHFWGSKETMHIGEELRPTLPLNQNDEEKQLDFFPLKEVWLTHFQNAGLTPSELIQIAFYLQSDKVYRYVFKKLYPWETKEYPKFEGWRKALVEELFPIEQIGEVNHYLETLNYESQIRTLFNAYFEDQDSPVIFDEVSEILSALILSIPDEMQEIEYSLFDILTDRWIDWAEAFSHTDNRFRQYFKLKYRLYVAVNFSMFYPSIEELARAYHLKLIDEQMIYQELISRGDESRRNLSNLTSSNNEVIKKFPSIEPLKDQVVKRILEIELKRGDLPTEVTSVVGGIEQYEGVHYFVDLLTALEKETFVRGYLYYYGSEGTKKEVFSQLLKACYPLKTDNETTLEELLKGKKVSRAKLLEAAMYAPQWLSIVEKFLKWEGLVSAAWYFHAHINETFSAEKETIVARFSPITPQEFQDGAFDIHWFKEAYETLGEERFQMLYQCAKYISGGALHRRSQLFADAVLGKLKLEDTKKAVIEKRNKDQLLSYSLIPIQNHQDVPERYTFLQQFLKESKKFGAQRRASEAKIVDIALENLARNAGYSDVTRLRWDMEAQKFEEVKSYLEPKVIDDLTVQLVIDEDGRSDLLSIKNGKPLKSVPSKYNKHETILTLKTIRTDLRDQYKRAKEELERSMVTENSFTLGEVTKLMENPILARLMKSLVFKTGNQLGYFVSGKLTGIGETPYKIQERDHLLIAHPVDLYESGDWSVFQHDAFTQKLKQPFKQVFRELYLANKDELASGNATRRYAGHQIQPKKAAALLKTRQWTVNYEEGLQKVYYKENIIVRLYAVADWFSPSDIEAPTLETVEFYNRLTDQPIEIKNIPKHLFSETMRDLDLAVSIAHVGGVDPESSLSTIEMRKAIVSESLKLMKLNNVVLEGNFAIIKGTLGEYSVHLGSANVYKQATGALFIVPVHSQQRGRIFLPFLDEDPKTAEILSKIVLLSEDQKIKDPFILEQIAGV